MYWLSTSSSSKYLRNWGMRVLKTPIISDPEDQDLNCLLQVCRRVWVSGSRNWCHRLMWINKGWAVRDTGQVLLLLFLPVKWFQVQHMKEHISLNFPHRDCASLKDKGWQMFIHAKINDSLFKRLISNQPFHHWWLPPLFHLHPVSSGGKTKQNTSICQGSEAKMNTIKERSQQFLPNECNGKEILKEDWAEWAWLDVCLRVAER